MATPLSALVVAPNTCSSPRLLSAALAGLLCVATAGCTTKQDAAGSSSTAGAAGEPGNGGAGVTATAGSSSTSGTAGAQSSMGDSGAGGAPAAGAASTSGGASGASGAGDTAGGAGTGGTQDIGAGGAAAEPPHITSSTNVGVMTVEDFTTMCDQRAGVVEVMTHCGGLATAKGFSYDSTTQLLSEHTCAGANTCAGWNCAIKD